MKNIDKSRFVKSYKYTSGGYWAYQRRMCVCVCVQNKVDCRWLFTIFGMQRNAPGAVAIRLHFKPFRVHALEELCNRRWSSALTNKCKRSIVDTAAARALPYTLGQRTRQLLNSRSPTINRYIGSSVPFLSYSKCSVQNAIIKCKSAASRCPLSDNGQPGFFQTF